MPRHSTEFEVSCHVIPHDKQRYPTVGDWQDYMGRITIRVSELSDPRYQQLIALHEIVEALLCKWTGVEGSVVDQWDMETPHEVGTEPGDDINAPYHKQHTIASVTERLAADLLGVDWNEYCEALSELDLANK